MIFKFLLWLDGSENEIIPLIKKLKLISCYLFPSHVSKLTSIYQTFYEMSGIQQGRSGGEKNDQLLNERSDFKFDDFFSDFQFWLSNHQILQVFSSFFFFC